MHEQINVYGKYVSSMQITISKILSIIGIYYGSDLVNLELWLRIKSDNLSRRIILPSFENRRMEVGGGADCLVPNAAVT